MNRASLYIVDAPRGRVDAQSDDTEARVAADLVARISGGDKLAEAALVARYRPRLLHVLARMTSDFAFAEDVANEALLIAISQLRTAPIDAPARLGGYLYGVAKNVMRNEQRKLARESDTDPALLDLVATESPNQRDVLEQIEVRSTVQQVMQSLPHDRYREALVRFYLQQEDKEEICAAMNMSRRDLTQVLSRARKSMRRALRADDE